MQTYTFMGAKSHFYGAFFVLLTIFYWNIPLLASKDGSDLSLNRYTDEGELAQITYASRFLAKCNPALGFTAADGNIGVLLRVKRKGSPLLAKPIGSIERAHGFSMCIVGLESDCSRARRDWHELVESDLFTYGELPSLEKLSGRMSAFFTRGLYQDCEDKISRPLASSAIILQSPRKASAHTSVNPARLQIVHNTGLIREGVFATLGSINTDEDGLERIALVVEPLITAREADVDLASSVNTLCDILIEHMESKGVREGCEFECSVSRHSGNGEPLYSLGSRENILEMLSK